MSTYDNGWDNIMSVYTTLQTKPPHAYYWIDREATYRFYKRMKEPQDIYCATVTA